MRKLSVLHALLTTGLLFAGSMTATAATIRVSQETSAGSGVFVQLGQIDAIAAVGQTVAQYYNLTSASYGGAFPAAVSNTTQSFFVSTSEGLAFFQLLDRTADQTGGSAQMLFTVVNDTVSVFVSDDNGEVVATDGGATVTGTWGWAGCCTDGGAFGSLDGGAWRVFASFADAPTGLGGGWRAVSADGSTLALDTSTGRRVRFDLVPEPGTITMFGFGLLGLAALRRRQAVR